MYSVFMFARSVLKITSAVITHCQIKNQKVLCKKYVLFDTHTDSLLYGTLAYNLAPAWFWRKQKKSRYLLILFLRLCHNSVKRLNIKSFLYFLKSENHLKIGLKLVVYLWHLTFKVCCNATVPSFLVLTK